MAASYPILTDSVVAGQDLSTKQFYVVSLQTDSTVDLFDTATDYPYGILQNKPTSGQIAEVMLIGRTKVEFGETVAIGQQIRCGAADGKFYIFAADTDRTCFCCGMCTEGGDAGEIGEAMVCCPTAWRGESA